MDTKFNKYLKNIDESSKEYNYKIQEGWKDLEKYFDYVLNDYFLPNGEHVRQEVWDFNIGSKRQKERQSNYAVNCVFKIMQLSGET